MNLFFKVNTPTSVSYEYKPELTDGNYKVAFYKKKTGDASALSRFTNLLPFTVSKSTGVIENNNLAVNTILCFMQDKNTLYIKANDNISCIEFYDVMGHLLLKEQYDDAGNEKLLSISNLRDGVYIVLIKTRSKIYKQKIILK